MIGWDYDYFRQLEADKKAKEAAAARKAFRIKIGLDTEKPWESKDVGKVHRAVHRSIKG